MNTDYEWLEQFPPVKASSAYDGDYSPKHMRKYRLRDEVPLAVGCGVVAVIVLGLCFVLLLALVVIG